MGDVALTLACTTCATVHAGQHRLQNALVTTTFLRRDVIGRHRCLRVLWAEADPAESSGTAAESQQFVPCKDANDVLVQRGVQAVQQCIEQAKALPEIAPYRLDALSGVPVTVTALFAALLHA